MSELFARRLSGKPIVGIDGTDYGTLATITMDPESGSSAISSSTPTAARRP